MIALNDENEKENKAKKFNSETENVFKKIQSSMQEVIKIIFFSIRFFEIVKLKAETTDL